MSTLVLHSKIELLPEHLKQQVLDYIEFLLSREAKLKSAPNLSVAEPASIGIKKTEDDMNEDALYAKFLHPLLSKNPSFDFLYAKEEDIYSEADLKIKYAPLRQNYA